MIVSVVCINADESTLFWGGIFDINSAKNYKYSILVKKLGVLKRLKEDGKKVCSVFIHTTIWPIWWFLFFYFDLVPLLYFLKRNRYFSIFAPVLTPLIYLLITVQRMR